MDGNRVSPRGVQKRQAVFAYVDVLESPDIDLYNVTV